MAKENNLERFIKAQERDFEIALSEVKRGRKQSHWMWYIFPQIQGLGFSETSKYYAIKDIDEAEAYLQHHILGERLIRICTELLALRSNDASSIFGNPDDLKLKSSMTLFASANNSNPVFMQVLEKFFDGKKDDKTLRLLNKQG
jgi:uncharacterized protein (DUF1810 family)